MTSASNGDAISIEALLRDLGFTAPPSIRKARAVLEAAGLTRAGKQAIASYKRGAAERALAAAIVRVCGKACAALANSGRQAVVASTCEICRGSNNRRAAIEAQRSLRRAGVRRVLVVGGTPPQQQELAALLASDDVALEFVDGTSASHNTRDAVPRMERAQLLVIWGSTPLRHAVSDLYTQGRPPHLRSITTSKRGIEALCREIVKSYAR